MYAGYRLIWLAFKAAAAAVLATLATGLVFFDVDQLLSIFMAPICRTPGLLVCDAAKWWSSYWWISFLVLSQPLLVLWSVGFIRRYAKPGERLAVGGVQLTVVGADGLLWAVSALLVVENGDTELPLIAILLPVYLVVLAMGICCLRSGRKQAPLTVLAP